MEQLWRKTSDLFWGYPVLWLPVLIADFIAFCLKQLCEFLRGEAVLRFLQRDSVLGNRLEYVTHGATYTVGVVLLSILRFSEIFLAIWFYTVALLVTAALTGAILQSCKSGCRLIALDIRRHRYNILVFSLKVFLLCVLAGAIATGAFILLTPRLNHPSLLIGISWSSFGIVLTTMLLGCVAFIISPSAITLLNLGSPAANTGKVKCGRVLAVLTVVVSSVIGSFIGTVVQTIFRDVSHIHAITSLAIYAGASLLGAFPYVPLFIALSLIATSESEAQREVAENA